MMALQGLAKRGGGGRQCPSRLHAMHHIQKDGPHPADPPPVFGPPTTVVGSQPGAHLEQIPVCALHAPGAHPRGAHGSQVVMASRELQYCQLTAPQRPRPKHFSVLSCRKWSAGQAVQPMLFRHAPCKGGRRACELAAAMSQEHPTPDTWLSSSEHGPCVPSPTLAPRRPTSAHLRSWAQSPQAQGKTWAGLLPSTSSRGLR